MLGGMLGPGSFGVGGMQGTDWLGLGGMHGPGSFGGGMNPYGWGAGQYGQFGGMNPFAAGPYGGMDLYGRRAMMTPSAEPKKPAEPKKASPMMPPSAETKKPAEPKKPLLPSGRSAGLLYGGMDPYGRRVSSYGGWASLMMPPSAKPKKPAEPKKPEVPKKPLLPAATGQPANVKLLAKSLDKFYKLHLPGGERCAIKSLHAACSFRASSELDLVWARAYARSVQARGAHRHGQLQRHWCVEQNTEGAVWRRSYRASTRSAPGVCVRRHCV